MNSLHDLKPSKNQQKKRKRVGRGNGAGTGTFSCRGVKGQSSRAGGRRRPGFEGGQTPLFRKLPKLKGFNNYNHKNFRAVNLDTLNNLFEDKATVTVEDLAAKGVVRKGELVKVLGNGKLEKALTVTVDKASASAIKAIEAAGGTCTCSLDKAEETKAKEEK